MTQTTSAGGGNRLFVVTTRSRLKGVRFFPAMFLASRRIRGQLRDTGEVVRWASVIAGPTEFWTITVWRSRHDMQLFMRSGPHDEIMWLFAKWLKSFWLMRWQPGAHEKGAWDGATLAPQRAPTNDSGDEEALAKRVLLDQALAQLPRLRAATGPTGAATYDSSPGARRRREEVANAAGALVRLNVAPWRTFGALASLRRLRNETVHDHAVLRTAAGIGRPGQVYLLVVWADTEGADCFVNSPPLNALYDRHGDRLWAITWTPENEFGHWDGLRLRRQRVTQTLRMTPAERALGDDAPTRSRRLRWRREAVGRRGR